jgi:hypothetical protein
MKWCAVVVLGASLLLATACDTNKKPLSPDFGNAVRQNMFVHIIGPRMPDPNAAPPELEGKRAHQAIERYHLGEIEKPEEESTREAAGGGK